MGPMLKVSPLAFINPFHLIAQGMFMETAFFASGPNWNPVQPRQRVTTTPP